MDALTRFYWKRNMRSSKVIKVTPTVSRSGTQECNIKGQSLLFGTEDIILMCTKQTQYIPFDTYIQTLCI
jgi:hypothetical protein